MEIKVKRWDDNARVGGQIGPDHTQVVTADTPVDALRQIGVEPEYITMKSESSASARKGISDYYAEVTP